MATHERVPLTLERRYQLLLEVSRNVRGSLDLEDVLERLLDAVSTMVPYDAAGIFVVNHGPMAAANRDPREAIASVVKRGFDGGRVEDDDMRMGGRGIVGHVIQSGSWYLARDVGEDPHYVMGRAATRSEIAVPIFSFEGVIGALNLESDVPRAFDEGDVDLLRFVADAAAGSIERATLHRQLMERGRMAAQMRLAHEVQTRLMPAGPPVIPGYDIAALCVPTFEIGGDYFDFIPLEDGRLALVLADVSGKGIPAAMHMTAFRSLVRTHAQVRRDPSHLANRVNGLLPDATGETAYVTCVYAILDPADGRFVYTNCGHNPPLLARRDGRIERLECGGLPLGVFTDTRFESDEVGLEPGDVVVLYTDGVVEGEDASGQEFGIEGLAEVVRASRPRSAGDLLQDISRATSRHSGQECHADDFTLMVLGRNPEPSP